MDSERRQHLLRQRTVARGMLTRIHHFIEAGEHKINEIQYWILKLTRSGNFKLQQSRTSLQHRQSLTFSKQDARRLSYFKPASLRVPPHLSNHQHQSLRSVNCHAVIWHLKNNALFARKHTDWFIVVNLKECLHSSVMIMPSR